MEIAIVITAYLLGSVPFGYLLARALKNIDIRRHGSGNIGATNVLRLLGWKAALPVFLLDAGKGSAAVLLAKAVGVEPSVYLLAGFAVLLGHSFSIFLKFKGGKGVATGLGVLLPLAGPVSALILLIFISVTALTRYVSLGSILGAISLPILFWAFNFELPYIYFGLATALLVIFRHHSNIGRLLQGTESKLGRKSKNMGEG